MYLMNCTFSSIYDGWSVTLFHVCTSTVPWESQAVHRTVRKPGSVLHCTMRKPGSDSESDPNSDSKSDPNSDL